MKRRERRAPSTTRRCAPSNRATRQPGFTRFAKDWSVGLRFDVTPQFMLRVEAHRVDGTGFLAVQDNPDAQALRRYWDNVMLQASFRF